jgi:hypothetical protein
VNFKFTKSYGDPQVVATLAKRSLGAVALNWKINGTGPVHASAKSEWNEQGIRFGTEGQKYYHQVRGQVSGTRPGDNVTVWFTGGGQTSDSFTYHAESESHNPVLVIAAEDYTGASPVQTGVTAPKYGTRMSTRSPPTASPPTSTTSTPTTARRRTRWAS